MGNLIYAIGHGLFAFALLFVWFMPVFQVRLTLGQKQKEYTWKLSIALTMLIKIIKPDCKISFLGWR
ncbi:hypothetical protein AALA56_08665 [Streptococcus hyointestinalis]|uniref:hypothetical protein n=1 Tax=Streptococcus hyointestinalis TaxID=1337 RepID=UPI00351410C6